MSPSHLATTTVQQWAWTPNRLAIQCTLKCVICIHENFVTFAFCIFPMAFQPPHHLIFALWFILSLWGCLSRDCRPVWGQPRLPAHLMQILTSMVIASLAAEKNEGLAWLAGIFTTACSWLLKQSWRALSYKTTTWLSAEGVSMCLATYL